MSHFVSICSSKRDRAGNEGAKTIFSHFGLTINIPNMLNVFLLHPFTSIRITSPLTVFLKDGQLDFSKVFTVFLTTDEMLVAVGGWKWPQQPGEGSGQGCIIHNLRSEPGLGNREEGKMEKR